MEKLFSFCIFFAIVDCFRLFIFYKLLSNSMDPSSLEYRPCFFLPENHQTDLVTVTEDNIFEQLKYME